MFPGYGFLTEESGTIPSETDERWIIDHTDFQFTVSLKCDRNKARETQRIVNGPIEPVYDPLRVELFTADRGGGATLNGQPLAVSKTRALSRENIHFRWRSGRNQPDVRTLPAFRRKTLKPVLDPVFGAGGEYRVAEGDGPLEHSFLDGTQSAAHANKHQGVWAKRNQKPPERWPAKSQELLAQIEAANAAEPAASGDRDREENGGKKGPGSWFNAAQLRAKIAERNEKLSAPSPEVPPGPAQRKALRSLEPDGLPRQQK